MGAELRDHRRPPPSLARVQADVQRTVDAGEVRLSESSPSATRFRLAGRGRVEVITFKPLSKNPGALHSLRPDHAMVQRLRRNRDALDFGYTQDRFEACISAHFVIAKTEPLQSGTRTMYFARPTRTGPGG